MSFSKNLKIWANYYKITSVTSKKLKTTWSTMISSDTTKHIHLRLYKMHFSTISSCCRSLN